MLFHIAEPDAWEAAQSTGSYAAESLIVEGFIHCSTLAQVLDTAKRYYVGRTGLVLLDVEERGLDVRWEQASSGEKFPHVYGRIPLHSVASARPLEPDASGAFTLA